MKLFLFDFDGLSAPQERATKQPRRRRKGKNKPIPPSRQANQIVVTSRKQSNRSKRAGS